MLVTALPWFMVPDPVGAVILWCTAVFLYADTQSTSYVMYIVVIHTHHSHVIDWLQSIWLLLVLVCTHKWHTHCLISFQCTHCSSSIIHLCYVVLYHNFSTYVRLRDSLVVCVVKPGGGLTFVCMLDSLLLLYWLLQLYTWRGSINKQNITVQLTSTVEYYRIMTGW